MESIDPVPIALDTDRQQQARRYAVARRWLSLADLLMGGAYLILWLAGGLIAPARDFVASLTTDPWLAVAAHAALLGIPYLIITFPLAFMSGYVLPHRFGQSTQSLSGWLSDQIKGLAVGGTLGLIALEAIYWLLRAAPGLWWLYAAGVMLLFTVVLSILGPVLIAPLFFRFTPLDDADLSQRLVSLAARAGAHVNGVFRFNMSLRTRSANAALMGLGATRRIVLGDTLLDHFTPDEVETILAHELGHHVHRDIPLGITVNALLTLGGLVAAHVALSLGAERLALEGIADPAGLPLLAAVTGGIGVITLPLGNAYSRWRERLADRYALESTHLPLAFADAMTRLANQNLAEVDPPAWVVWLLYTHPPIRERVAAAQAFAAGSGLLPGS